MNTRTNRQWLLKQRPGKTFGRECFDWAETPAPDVGEGQFLVRTTHISCDPTQRGWATMDTYVPVVPLGEPMRAIAAGEVVESRHPAYREGDKVQGLFGWQDYCLTDGGGLMPVTRLPDGVPVEQAMSVFGLTGLTAYFGLLHVGQAKAGETVLVSGAAGATGSVVGQIAKIKGCRAVGIAGGADKCRYLTEELGFDAAVDYRKGNVFADVAAACPNGADVFFDNVGGEMLDAALMALAMKGRVVICGAISRYQDMAAPAGALSSTYFNLLLKRGRMEGFIVLDFYGKAQEAITEMSEWVKAGKLKDRVDVRPGLENAPEIYDLLYTGGNTGKLLIQV